MTVHHTGRRTASDARPSRVRTFKPRQGRLRPRRREALAGLWPAYGMAVTGGPLHPGDLFGRRAPLVLEIGSGMGEGVAGMAAGDPGRDYLAVEAHTAGVANLLMLAESLRLRNLRVAHGDGLELAGRLAPDTLDTIQAFFPDPWPKPRHHKRRLFQPQHVALLRSRLVRGGTLRTATDSLAYAEAAREVLEKDPELVNAYGGWAPRPSERPVTRYEQRALDAGRPVFELAFLRR